MLSNLNKVIKGQGIQRGKEKEHNRLYYYLEIAQTFKDNQIKRNQKRKQKRKRKENEEEEEEEEQEEIEEIEEEQKQKHKKRSKQNNNENKKRNRRNLEDKGQEKEGGEEEEQKRRKKQSKKEEDTRCRNKKKENSIRIALGVAGLEWRTCSPTRSRKRSSCGKKCDGKSCSF